MDLQFVRTVQTTSETGPAISVDNLRSCSRRHLLLLRGFRPLLLKRTPLAIVGEPPRVGNRTPDCLGDQPRFDLLFTVLVQSADPNLVRRISQTVSVEESPGVLAKSLLDRLRAWVGRSIFSVQAL
jgi:hypothetical protein